MAVFVKNKNFDVPSFHGKNKNKMTFSIIILTQNIKLIPVKKSVFNFNQKGDPR